MSKREKKKDIVNEAAPQDDFLTDAAPTAEEVQAALQDGETGEERVQQIPQSVQQEGTFGSVKRLYRNRAKIMRRMNIASIVVSLLFTMLYAAYNVWSIINSIIAGPMVTVWILLGIYAVLIVAFVVVLVCSDKSSSKALKKYNKALKVFRFSIRTVSIAMAVVGIILSVGSTSTINVVLRVVMLVVSIVSLVFQGIPMLFSCFISLIRWINSPGRRRFSVIMYDWYNQVCSGKSRSVTIKRVSAQYKNQIIDCMENYLIPGFGKKRVKKLTPALMVKISGSYRDTNLIQGILKNMSEYAVECGYIAEDPTKDLGFEGTIEEDPVPKATLKSRISSWFNEAKKNTGKNFRARPKSSDSAETYPLAAETATAEITSETSATETTETEPVRHSR